MQLALFEPLFIIPLLQVFWTFFATLNGGIFFREFFVAEFIENNVAGFTFGVFIIFLGVYLLAPRNNNSDGSGHRDEKISLSEGGSSGLEQFSADFQHEALHVQTGGHSCAVDSCVK